MRICIDRERPRPNKARREQRNRWIKSAFEEAAASWLVLAEQMEWIDRERERKAGARLRSEVAVVEAQCLNLHNMGGTEFDKICEVIR